MPHAAALVAAGHHRRGARCRVLLGALKGRRNADVSTGYLLRQLFIALVPLMLFVIVAIWSWQQCHAAAPVAETGGSSRSDRSRTRPRKTRAACRSRLPSSVKAGLPSRPTAPIAQPQPAADWPSRPPGGLSEPPAARRGGASGAGQRSR